MSRAAALLSVPEPDVDSINLRRVLLRLEQQILLPSPESQLLHSKFEQEKVAQNLEYARTLFLRLQHNAPNVKSQSRKHAQQAEITRHRALIKRLAEKLYDMRREDHVAETGDSTAAAEEEEDLLSKYFAPEPTQIAAPATTGHDVKSKLVDASVLTSDGLRSRGTKTFSVVDGPMPTKAPTTTLRGELFGSSGGKSSTFYGATDKISTEKQLEYQDATQAELTSSLVLLAKQLKASSLAFAEDLALDAEAVGRTESSLGKGQSGLEAASRGMGVLRKMSEGRWWWERYIMFIIIALLWIAEIALVFIGPKIRF